MSSDQPSHQRHKLASVRVAEKTKHLHGNRSSTTIAQRTIEEHHARGRKSSSRRGSRGSSSSSRSAGAGGCSRRSRQRSLLHSTPSAQRLRLFLFAVLACISADS